MDQVLFSEPSNKMVEKMKVIRLENDRIAREKAMEEMGARKKEGTIENEISQITKNSMTSEERAEKAAEAAAVDKLFKEKFGDKKKL